MTVASLDKGSKAAGIYLSSTTGLLCRVPDGCIQRFAAHPGQTPEGMQLAAALRNEHEREVHGYEHPKPPPEDRRTVRNLIHQHVVGTATRRRPL